MREIKFRFWNSLDLKMISDDDLKNLTLQTIRESEGVLLQFTGIKDKNNVEIYEGDIIKYTQHHFNTPMVKEHIKVVEFDYDKWTIYTSNAGESNVEVIGNIYQNSDLIK